MQALYLPVTAYRTWLETQQRAGYLCKMFSCLSPDFPEDWRLCGHMTLLSAGAQASELECHCVHMQRHVRAVVQEVKCACTGSGKYVACPRGHAACQGAWDRVSDGLQSIHLGWCRAASLNR